MYTHTSAHTHQATIHTLLRPRPSRAPATLQPPLCAAHRSQTFFEGFSTSTNTSAEAGRALFAHVVAMFEHAKRNMATGSYMPALDLASLNCLSKLPWWHEPHGGGGGGGAAAGATGVTRRQ